MILAQSSMELCGWGGLADATRLGKTNYSRPLNQFQPIAPRGK
ncbi:hypothetical protein SPLC1_S542440 [Arthrospira platensis C1]|nr:hypothetical protein SPLC1_S542440 [Arthrospira platensis C1]